MKFAQLKKSLQTEVLPCYIVSGEDYFLCESSVSLIEKQMFGELSRTNINKQSFSTENLDIKEFVTTLNTMPFFADKKLVILKEYDCKNSNEIISQLKEYLKTPCASTVLVIVTLPDSSFFKPLESSAEVVDCSRLDAPILQGWIKQNLSQYNPPATITIDAMETLINYCNSYLSKISKEITKLVSFSGGKIEKHHVEELVPKDLEYSIFELTDSIAKGDNKKAELIKNDLMANRKTMSSVLGILSSYFRRLFYSIVSGDDTKTIASNLGVKEYAVIKSKEQAKKFGAKKLKDIVTISAELDYKTKTGLMSVENATDFLLLKILELKAN